jgi:uroporphyrin-III C-methyltransferase
MAIAFAPGSLPDFPHFPAGEVWLAGAGPGDPRLLTLLALHALKCADEIVFDALVDARVLKLAREGAVLTFAGKRGGRPSPEQRDINELLIERARAGRRVLRLKGGDPFVFGRGGEEAMALAAAGVAFRVIPGVTSGLAAAALAAIPATTRQSNHAVILAAGRRRGEGDPAVDWEALARTGQPIILYMPIAQLAEITTALQRGGLAPQTPAAILHAATTEGERVLETTLGTALEDARREGIGAPAIFVVGAIARLRGQLLGTMVGWR